jgi:hypothetical protein
MEGNTRTAKRKVQRVVDAEKRMVVGNETVKCLYALTRNGGKLFLVPSQGEREEEDKILHPCGTRVLVLVVTVSRLRVKLKSYFLFTAARFWSVFLCFTPQNIQYLYFDNYPILPHKNKS